jgi:predicted lactoylglutathione lyase
MGQTLARVHPCRARQNPIEFVNIVRDNDRMSAQIFVNLPVRDLDRSMSFFERLGFTFNPQFTDENAACMVIDENIFVMLLVERFFKNFTRKPLSDARKSTEVLVAFSVEGREAVDRVVEIAVGAGGAEARDPQDHGWMYGRSFEDLDGHIWEVLWMESGQAA